MILSSKLQLQQRILGYGTNFQNRILLVENRKNKHPNWTFCIKFTQKKVFVVKTGKSEHLHGILHNWINLSTKFQLKLTIWVFGPNLPKKGTTEQNNQSNKLNAFAFCVVNVNSTIIFEHFKDFKNLLILFRIRGRGERGWARKHPTSFSLQLLQT